jgi:hypothetical protein
MLNSVSRCVSPNAQQSAVLSKITVFVVFFARQHKINFIPQVRNLSPENKKRLIF